MVEKNKPLIILFLLFIYHTPLALTVAIPDTQNLESVVQKQINETAKTVESVINNSKIKPVKKAKAWGELGMLYQAYTFHLEANSCYEQAIILEKNNFIWHYLSAITLLSDSTINDSLDIAIQRLNTANSLFPQQAYILIKLADSLLKSNQIEKANIIIKNLLEINPNHVNGLVMQGKIMQLKSQYLQSIKPLQKALNLSPKSTRINYPIGVAYRAIENMTKAQYFLKRSGNVSPLESDPILSRVLSIKKGVRVHQLDGMVAANSGDYKTAVKEFENSIKFDPNNARARVNLATAYIFTGNRTQAYIQLKKAIQLNPELHIANYNLASLFAEDKNDIKALKYYKKASEISRKHRDTYFGLAHCLMRLNHPVEAIDAYKQVILIDPSSKAAQYWYAIALAKSHRYLDSINNLQELYNKNPQRIQVAEALIRVISASPNAKKNQKQFALILAIKLKQSKNTVNHGSILAMALAANTKYDDALKTINQVIKFSKNNPNQNQLNFYQNIRKKILESKSINIPWYEQHPIFKPAASLRLHLSSINTQ